MALTKETVNNAVKNVIDMVKLTVEQNIMQAVGSKALKLAPDQLQRLTSIVRSSIDQGYLRAIEQVEHLSK